MLSFLPRNIQRSGCVVRFEGGLGTQIIQAAAYYCLRGQGVSVYADMSYFDGLTRDAPKNRSQRFNFRSWALDQYGVFPEQFTKGGLVRKLLASTLGGIETANIGLTALRDSSIRRMFEPLVVPSLSVFELANKKYLCIHVRRGDYLQVASHLVPDEAFINVAKKFINLVDVAVVLSDSPLNVKIRESLSTMFPAVHFLDHIEAKEAHWIMRRAAIIIGSNSTFSLTAALLNVDALALFPRQWYGPESEKLERPIRQLSTFQLFD